ncbi:MAG: hypBA [Verrucomicrobiales bacterium]|nr:hypBA [Verrucomicrobiales bacterium]
MTAASMLLDHFTAVAVELDDAFATDSIPNARFEFRGIIGDRVSANIENWLLHAPEANPGMLEMFRARDRNPPPQIVPWAGEFVGKYLISAVQALRMTDDPRLRTEVSNVVKNLIATQAEDGYLGPFPNEVRLLKNWDLWGHHHVIYGLLLWHEQTGDRASFGAARKAGDLVCRTFLDTNRRVLDAGDSEMNMAILTAMGMLHRITGEPRYLRMAREVEKDWEKAGDYLHAGLDGREFYQSPRPRWESLHDLQGLVELWRITGETKYRDAFLHHWRSIRRWDRRNTGGFSSGEQATGNPYAPTAIETCCTVAWMALTIDYLRLTGDARAADELELATFNAGLGAQHSSGRWWTYNTPMDGIREASAHTIVFQSRAGTPELNCCSVNGPRVLGMLSEWAVMRSPDGFLINWYGPESVSTQLADGTDLKLTCESTYPGEGTARWKINSLKNPRQFALSFRLPAWSAKTQISINGRPITLLGAGHYERIDRKWQNDDLVELKFDLSLRAIAGANEASGKVSLYRGPLLLTYDQRFNKFDEDQIPSVDLAKLNQSRVLSGGDTTVPSSRPKYCIAMDLPTSGENLRLVDFASAGSSGTRYRSWLKSTFKLPEPAVTQLPRDAAKIPLGAVRFQWRPQHHETNRFYRLEFSTNSDFHTFVLKTNTETSRLLFDTRTLIGTNYAETTPIWWRVVTANSHAETIADLPAAYFTIDRHLQPQPAQKVQRSNSRAELIVHALKDSAPPEFGGLKSIKCNAQNTDGTELNGRDQMIVYDVPEWPEEDFTVALQARITLLPEGHIGQIFSAWARGSDDPLRLVIDEGKLFARVEAGAGFSTPGFNITTNRWYSILAVKQDTTLTLYVDGKVVGSCAVPATIATQAKSCALGGNPNYSGNEFLSGRFADFRFFDRALELNEIERFAKAFDLKTH